MTPVACSMCSKPYRLTGEAHESYCSTCLNRIHADARSAEQHMNSIRAGRMRTIPDNERQRVIRDDARRRQLPRKPQ